MSIVYFLNNQTNLYKYDILVSPYKASFESDFDNRFFELSATVFTVISMIHKTNTELAEKPLEIIHTQKSKSMCRCKIVLFYYYRCYISQTFLN